MYYPIVVAELPLLNQGNLIHVTLFYLQNTYHVNVIYVCEIFHLMSYCIFGGKARRKETTRKDQGVGWRMGSDWILGKLAWGCGLDSTGSR
jgi:hypothetical protein